MNTINILNGITLASQEEVTGHTGNNNDASYGRRAYGLEFRRRYS